MYLVSERSRSGDRVASRHRVGLRLRLRLSATDEGTTVGSLRSSVPPVPMPLRFCSLCCPCRLWSSASTRRVYANACRYVRVLATVVGTACCMASSSARRPVKQADKMGSTAVQSYIVPAKRECCWCRRATCLRVEACSRATSTSNL